MANTSDLRAALIAKYPAASYALMWEVANATGYVGQRRWADCLAMSLWPSRGLHLSGFELKASRTDWQKELNQPAKAESICKYCDYWWIVAAEKGIVRDDELPETWGLQVLGKRGLTVVKPAPKLDPIAVDRRFLAALCRGAAVPAVADNSAALRKEYERGRLSEVESHNRALKYSNDRLEEITRKVQDFEESANLKISDSWRHSSKEVGRVVREVLDGRHNRDLDDIQRMRAIAAEIVDRIDQSGALKEVANA